MKLIKQITNQYKGVEHAEYNFNGNNAIVSGQNGTCKTTIGDAHYWLFSDKDYSLRANPEVHPDFLKESEPSVEEVYEIDGKEVSFKKIQTDARTKKQKDANAPIKIKNTYEVNSVPMSQTDFETKIQEYGIDPKRFLLESHPEIFMGQKSAECREILFGMAGKVTDKQIADSIGCEEVSNLLDSYTAEEIAAMKKREKKTASERMDAIPNQIIGLEKARVDIDVKSLEEQASTVQTKIDTAESDMRKNPVESVDALNEQATTILRKIDLLNAEADRERIQRFEESKRAEADIVSKLQTRRKEYADKQAYIAEELAKAQNAKKAYDELGEEFAKVKAEQFDESQNVCKYCGQKLPENTQEENRKRFVKIQQERKDQINKEAIRYRQINRDSADNAKQAEESLAEIKSAIADLEHLLDEAEAKTKIFDSPVDASGSDEYKKLAADFALIKQKIADHEKHEGERQNKLLQIRIWREELSKIQNEIGMAKVNERINEQIEDLRQEQKDVAQAVANAEKILYQLSMVSMKKNETLTDEVNSHFTRVKFRLFRYLKNGETKDDCTPLVLTSDGEYRDATFSANTAAIVLAKLDIIAGLQKFYGVDYPVILDGAEALDSENSNIDVPYQLIMLKVTDDKELVIA